MDNLNFKGGNPGAVQHGNFINYYQFHPPDKRIELLPTDIWGEEPHFNALDLGCNSGDLTISLYNFFTKNATKNCDILGIDIDPTLIQRAIEKNTNPRVNFHCLDFMDENKRQTIIRKHLKDNNCTGKFSAAFCFSVTMWIHLNNGDDGLKAFLREISLICKVLVIEPQPWKCYRAAVKRMKLSKAEFPFFKELKIRENVESEIESYLINDCNMEKIRESTRSDWGRKLLIFCNK